MRIPTVNIKIKHSFTHKFFPKVTLSEQTSEFTATLLWQILSLNKNISMIEQISVRFPSFLPTQLWICTLFQQNLLVDPGGVTLTYAKITFNVHYFFRPFVNIMKLSDILFLYHRIFCAVNEKNRYVLS